MEKLEHRVIEAEYFLTSLRAWLRDGEAVSSDESPQNVSLSMAHQSSSDYLNPHVTVNADGEQ